MARTPRSSHIDKILRDWPYEPSSVNVRVVKGHDGRDVVQMRIEMGVLQLEMAGRPDGNAPHGFATFLDYLEDAATREPLLMMTEEQCVEADREFVQFYHRRICWLAMREFARAVLDADHTLRLMDFCRDHSPDAQWTMTHEQYRPFVVFHRTQAATLQALESEDAEGAVEAVNGGLVMLRGLLNEPRDGEPAEDQELADRLIELRESVREKFHVGRTLQEQLGDAIASEQYELAARLRDRLASRQNR